MGVLMMQVRSIGHEGAMKHYIVKTVKGEVMVSTTVPVKANVANDGQRYSLSVTLPDASGELTTASAVHSWVVSFDGCNTITAFFAGTLELQPAIMEGPFPKGNTCYTIIASVLKQMNIF